MASVAIIGAIGLILYFAQGRPLLTTTHFERDPNTGLITDVVEKVIAS